MVRGRLSLPSRRRYPNRSRSLATGARRLAAEGAAAELDQDLAGDSLIPQPVLAAHDHHLVVADVGQRIGMGLEVADGEAGMEDRWKGPAHRFGRGHRITEDSRVT